MPFSPRLRRRIRQLHRWIALAFSLPLLILALTGFLLSFEPLLNSMSRGTDSLTATRSIELLQSVDPQGKAKTVTHRGYEGTLEVAGPGLRPMVLDIETGEVTQHDLIARTFILSRQIHKAFVGDLSWLVLISTMAMGVLIVLGLLMGWPRRANTVSGWHRVGAWIGMPLLAITTVTGVLMSFGVTMGGGGAAPITMGRLSEPMSMVQAVQAVEAQQDLSAMAWIRPAGPRIMMRYAQGDRFQGYFVTPDEIVAVPRNLPRAIHEGLWSIPLGLAMNLIVSILTSGLILTGLIIWLRRRRPASSLAAFRNVPR
ncbi:PepSY domain-containing protein [Celeribacter sp.]|uniref:PepSY domain-containing protein n=1 Tax=Celeribacter sp. TaxID=1890673 RepID=UPI003A8E13D1